MEKLLKSIKVVLDLPQADVEIIHTLGGMTNINYLVAINDERYIVRVPGNGTGSFIKRKEEEENLKLTAALGINPKHIYFNVESGLKITKEISDANTLTPQTANVSETMQMVASVFTKLHSSPIPMNNRFDLFSLIKRFEMLVLQEHVQKFQGYEEVKKAVVALKVYYESLVVEECPSHIDPSYTNFILRGHRRFVFDRLGVQWNV